jgi:hypothetical protein
MPKGKKKKEEGPPPFGHTDVFILKDQYKKLCEMRGVVPNIDVLKGFVQPEKESGMKEEPVVDSLTLDTSRSVWQCLRNKATDDGAPVIFDGVLDWSQEMMKSRSKTKLFEEVPESGGTEAEFSGSSIQLPPLEHDGLGVGGIRAITYAFLGKEVAKPIGPYLSLKKLTLNGCRIRDEGMDLLAELLNPTHAIPLESLELCNNSIGAQGCACLAKAMETNTSLKSLRLDWNRTIDCAAVGALVPGIAAKKNLKYLSLASCNVRQRGCEAIMQLLITSGVELAIMDLQDNFLGPMGLVTLLLGLRKNTALLDINLRGIGLRPEDALDVGPTTLSALQAIKKLNDFLMKTNTLQKMDITGITEQMAKALLPALKREDSPLCLFRVDQTLPMELLEVLYKTGGGKKKGKKGKKKKK